MTTLGALKLTDAKKPSQVPQIVQRRNKLAKRVWQQIELAKAREQGMQFRVAKFKSYIDSETGLRKQIETQMLVKQWWFTTEAGKLAISVRYGSKVLELSRGKFAVEVAHEKDLAKTLDAIKVAVLAGELDAQIATASMNLRKGFGK